MNAKPWIYRTTEDHGPNRQRVLLSFPLNRDAGYFHGLLSETLITKYRNGRAVHEWRNLKRERNEPIDARTYATAALFALMAGGLNFDGYCQQFERMLLEPPTAAVIEKPNGAPPAAPSVIRSRFVWG